MMKWEIKEELIAGGKGAEILVGAEIVVHKPHQPGSASSEGSLGSG